MPRCKKRIILKHLHSNFVHRHVTIRLQTICLLDCLSFRDKHFYSTTAIISTISTTAPAATSTIIIAITAIAIIHRPTYLAMTTTERESCR